MSDLEYCGGYTRYQDLSILRKGFGDCLLRFILEPYLYLTSSTFTEWLPSEMVLKYSFFIIEDIAKSPGSCTTYIKVELQVKRKLLMNLVAA